MAEVTSKGVVGTGLVLVSQGNQSPRGQEALYA